MENVKIGVLNGVNERSAAVDVLVRVTEDGAFNNIALREAFDANALTERQRAYVTEVVNGVLRNVIYVDYMINSFAGLPVEKMRPLVANCLRAAVYQLRFMRSEKPFAVCNETVEIVKRRGYRELAGFVNGILRRFTSGADIKMPDKGLDLVKYLSVRYSVPAFIVGDWAERFGAEVAESVCASLCEPPFVTACVNRLRTDKETLRARLGQSGVTVSDGNMNGNALNLRGTSDMTRLPVFAEGLFHVMDEAAMAAVELLDPREGDAVLDLCAAPGGKSFYAAELMGNKGAITAVDIHAHKARLVMDGALRLGLGIVKTVTADATVRNGGWVGKFDKVLVDAPCTGFGVIRKKPDIRLGRGAEKGEDITERGAKLVKLQRELLGAAAEYVKVGGTLVYSTCTLTEEENEGNAYWFGVEFPAFKEESRRLVLPDEAGTDGFFMVKFVKTA